jgi:hypothetical protein
MNSSTFGSIAAVLLFASCSSTDPRSGIVETNELSARIEEVRAGSDLAKQRVEAAVKSLKNLTHADFKEDATAAFVDFVAAVDASTQQSDQLHASVVKMKEESVPLFKKWEQSLEAFSSDQMRQHSKERQQKTHERFDAIVSSAEAAQVACDALNVRLRDHVAYLRFDLNSSALAMIQGEVVALEQSAATLSTQLVACQDAAKAYVEAASLPKAGAPANHQ